MLCGCSAAPVTGDRDPLSYYPNLPQENRYHVYDEEGLRAFVENGSGIVLIGDVSDEDSAYAVYVLHDMLETYDLSAGYYEVINEEDQKLVSLIRKHLLDKSVYIDDVSSPLVLFVRKGVIVNLFDDDYFEDSPSYAVPKLQQEIESMQSYLEEQKVDACDDGCQLGGAG